MWTQHDLYFLKDCVGLTVDADHVGGSPLYLFRIALYQLHALSGGRPSFASITEPAFQMRGFDHRVLQLPHMKIAAFYRFLVKDVAPPAFSSNKKRYREYLIEAWKTYFIHEVGSLVEDISFAEHTVRAVLYENTEKGYRSEDFLSEFLDRRYGKRCIELCEPRSMIPHDVERQGFIYVLVNPALRPNLLKIGKTTRLPQSRAEEITGATGVPMRFYVAYETQVADCHEVERLVHRRLHNFRVADNREFFELPLNCSFA
jgi:hypothetical protein